MWRAIFLGLGIVLCILGAECMVVEKAVLARVNAPSASAGPADAFLGSPPDDPPREIKPAEWAPWSLLASGVVVILYSHTIRRNG